MADKDLQKPPTGALMLVMALLVIFAIVIIVGLVKGFSAFIADGGWIWLVVTGGLALFVYLISKANKRT